MNTTNHKTKKKKKPFKLTLPRLNKKASAYWFIYALIFAFALTILYIIFGQILNVYIYPTSVELTGGHMEEPTKWLGFWGFVPYIILVIIGLFLFFKLTQRDTQGE
jgi:hypothetical protein